MRRKTNSLKLPSKSDVFSVLHRNIKNKYHEMNRSVTNSIWNFCSLMPVRQKFYGLSKRQIGLL